MRTRSISLLAGITVSVLLSLTAATATALATDEVVVASGDTLSGIALRHGLTVAQLASINGLTDPNRIYVGQRLAVEVPAAAVAVVPAAPVTPAATVHVVAPGEHLTGIARRYGTTIAALVAANNISNPSFIRVGTQLTVPGSAAAPGAAAAPAVAAPRVHQVAAGENLTRIARRYGTTVAAIVAANGIGNPSFVRIGARLTIPGTAAAPAVAAPAAPSAPTADMPATMATLIARRAAIGAMIAEAANRHGVPVAFAKAVAWQESGWQQDVTSHVGAMGVMQLMPDTVTWVAEAMLHTGISGRDTAQNIEAGVRLLRHYLDRYDGDKARVLAAYYQGQTAVDRYGIFGVSRPYIASILVLERMFGG
ncbi:MAG: LysM peptidoglycan-binding domain-containing protein [Chloroflexota bacterium]